MKRRQLPRQSFHIMHKILIVGTGALATLFAARLARAGHHITMLGTWKAGLSALRKEGARLVEANGEEHQFEVHATEDARECVGLEHALVLVKAWQTERAAEQLKECLAQAGLAVTLQNGLGNRETLAQSLGPGRVAGGEGSISIERNQALGPIEEALRTAKFTVNIVEDARSLVWGKLVINAAINPLSALLRVPNGILLERPSAREMMGMLAREAAQVAGAEKIQLPFSDPIAAVEDVAHRTAGNHSSMLQDVLRQAPTEIEAICGAVVKAGQRHGIETPANSVCWQLVKALTE
jgi:2-dehydropantoate 2-reductase